MFIFLWILFWNGFYGLFAFLYVQIIQICAPSKTTARAQLGPLSKQSISAFRMYQSILHTFNPNIVSFNADYDYIWTCNV